MIEHPVVDALVAFLTTARPPELAAFEIRPHDSDEHGDAPPSIVVKVTSVKPRVLGTNLMDVAVEITLRANPADVAIADFEAAWTWLASEFYPATDAVAALTNADLHCYTLQAEPADTDITLDENERRRALTLTGAIVGKNL